MSRGKYIVLEGPEGVGKTTQILELARRLQSAGLPVRMLREPDSQSDLTARAIRQLTQDPRYPMNTHTEVLLYNAARSQSLQVIKKSVDQGVICIVDRNYLTTLAIQYYGRGDVPDYDTINRIINFAVDGVEPDLCVVLDAPVQLLKERAHKRGQGERFDNLDEAFLERVRAGYLWEAKQRNLPVVFATEDQDSIANDIWKLVTGVLAIRDKTAASAVSEPTSVKQILDQKKQAAQQAEAPVAEQTGSIFIPQNLRGKAKTDYEAGVQQLLNLHATLAKDADVAVTDAIKKALPVAAAVTEASAITTFASDDPLAKIARQELHETYNEATPVVAELIGHHPRLELGLAANLLYKYTNLSAEQLADQVDSWPYAQRAAILQDYLDQTSDLNLGGVRYIWELQTDFATMQLLNSHTDVTVTPQCLTPRYGYEVPAAIEEAGLTERFEACFDASLELYSQLQSEGHDNEAQYITLLGHRQRFTVSMSVDALLHMSQALQYNTIVAKVLAEMREQVSGVHPLIGARLAALATPKQKVATEHPSAS